ncbi:MAG TPA: hypothetical protein DHU96_10885 [Actinobacteria bacterium]|nr:hypothetical protein [Actinomycetota bacterium]
MYPRHPIPASRADADGALPVTGEVRDEAHRRGIDLVILPTAQAIGVLTETTEDTSPGFSRGFGG